MSVTLKFRSPAGIISLNLDKISLFQITRQRNSCELLALTPENPRPQTPYSIARRDKEWQLQDLMADLANLKKETGDLTYDITDTGIHLVQR
jgi:hypothetical protein